MALLADVKAYIDQLEVKYRAAVSEATFSKIGKSINFILHRTHEKKDFFLNGRYSIFSGQTGIDGLCVFQFDAEIFNVYAFNMVPGTGGTTELDIKRATTPGGAFSSIFSTTPKITSSAAAGVWIGIGETVTGCTAPVLTSNPYNVDAGDALRIDMISSMSGSPENCGIIIHHRPR